MSGIKIKTTDKNMHKPAIQDLADGSLFIYLDTIYMKISIYSGDKYSLCMENGKIIMIPPNHEVEVVELHCEVVKANPYHHCKKPKVMRAEEKGWTGNQPQPHMSLMQPKPIGDTNFTEDINSINDFKVRDILPKPVEDGGSNKPNIRFASGGFVHPTEEDKVAVPLTAEEIVRTEIKPMEVEEDDRWYSRIGPRVKAKKKRPHPNLRGYQPDATEEIEPVPPPKEE